MATDPRRLARRLVAAIGLLFALSVVLPTHADAAGWWQPLALAGMRVDSVSVDGGTLRVIAGGVTMTSHDGGAAFTVSASGPPVSAPTGGAVVDSAGVAWAVRHGVVLTGAAAGRVDSLAPDPGAPYLGAEAHLLAAPAALPGVVVAVGTDGHVWRRASDGRWSTAFILLPAGGVAGVPRVTSVAAFTEPLSVAVYLGVDGYGVLLSDDAGADWVRADPGLPGGVRALATDATRRSLYAATDDGLWVHVLQSFPAPPVYRDASLWWRWLGIGLTALLASSVAMVALRRLLPPSG